MASLNLIGFLKQRLWLTSDDSALSMFSHFFYAYYVKSFHIPFKLVFESITEVLEMLQISIFCCSSSFFSVFGCWCEEKATMRAGPRALSLSHFPSCFRLVLSSFLPPYFQSLHSRVGSSRPPTSDFAQPVQPPRQI